MSFLLPDLLYSQGALRPALAVRIVDGRVTDVLPVESLPPDAVVERLPGRALLPGFVNAHSHAFQRGLRGHVQYADGPDSFWSWRDRMYRLANALDPDGIEAVSALAFLEMARAGFTTVGEFHYLHHAPDGTRYADPDELARRVVAAADRVGIRIVLLRVAYARAGAGRDPDPLQRRFYDRGPDDVLAAVARLRATGVAVGLAPHSTRACPADWLRAFAGFDGPVHAHVDEQPAEIAASLKEHGRTPLQVFADAGLVNERFTAVHLTHPDDDELATLRAAGGRVCVCPTTELDLGDGLFPVARAAGIDLCIGSDSHALIDPFTELRSIEWHARAASGRRNVLGPFGHPDGLANALLDAGTRG
ncbi:MAG: formimidoylglutamate deiminase, partial [Pseudomonadota bacterium]|nr:formimidoylglutamate deiminase [Pseudomonadota bacterium]